MVDDCVCRGLRVVEKVSSGSTTPLRNGAKNQRLFLLPQSRKPVQGASTRRLFEAVYSVYSQSGVQTGHRLRTQPLEVEQLEE